MIGEQIRYFRKKSGLSQKDLASRLFVSQQAVGKWERNEATPNPEAIVKMSAILGISTDALLGQAVVSTDDAQNDIRAAFFEGAEDLPPEEMDALWEDAREYIQYKLAQRRKQNGQWHPGAVYLRQPTRN